MNDAKKKFHKFFLIKQYKWLPSAVQYRLVRFYLKVLSLAETMPIQDSKEIHEVMFREPYFISFRFTYDFKTKMMNLVIEYEGENTFNV